jgi:hypothetical protein
MCPALCLSVLQAAAHPLSAPQLGPVPLQFPSPLSLRPLSPPSRWYAAPSHALLVASNTSAAAGTRRRVIFMPRVFGPVFPFQSQAPLQVHVRCCHKICALATMFLLLHFLSQQSPAECAACCCATPVAASAWCELSYVAPSYHESTLANFFISRVLKWPLSSVVATRASTKPDQG